MKKSELLATFGLLLAGSVLSWQFFFAPKAKNAPRPKPVHVAVTQPLPEPPLPPSPPAPGPGPAPFLESEAPPPGPSSQRSASFSHKPQIAIVIDDMGLNLSGSQRAVKLPAYVTLSFIPYAERLVQQAKEAHEMGHELLLHMPMEPIGRQDPGPGALLTTLTPLEVKARFDHALDSFEGFDGVNNHMGSRFTAYPAGMEIVIDELSKRKLFFLDSRTSAETVGEKLAHEHHLPTISRDVFLDDNIAPDAIHAELMATEKVARRKGYAVAIGHPHENTLSALETWLPEAQKDGFELVPLRHLIKNEAAPLNE